MPNERGYALPALPKPVIQKELQGPTPWSNWVLPGQIIAGAYPASMDDEETEKILTTLLELGINTFVCLQAEVNIHISEHAWRSGQGLRPYIRDAQKVLSRAHEAYSTCIRQQKIDFLHLPIIDGNVTTDNALTRLAQDCCERVLKGEKLYVHCWGGHGRTGTLLAVMLSWLYNLPYSSALKHVQAFHDSRIFPQGVRSPQTPVQRAQVRRILASPPPASLVPLIAAATPHIGAAATPAAAVPYTAAAPLTPVTGSTAPAAGHGTGRMAAASRPGALVGSKGLLGSATPSPAAASKGVAGAVGSRPSSAALSGSMGAATADRVRSNLAISLGSSMRTSTSRPTSSSASSKALAALMGSKLHDTPAAARTGAGSHIPDAKLSSSSLAEGISKAAAVGSSALDRLSLEFQKLKAGGANAGSSSSSSLGSSAVGRGSSLSYLLGGR